MERWFAAWNERRGPRSRTCGSSNSASGAANARSRNRRGQLVEVYTTSPSELPLPLASAHLQTVGRFAWLQEARPAGAPLRAWGVGRRKRLRPDLYAGELLWAASSAPGIVVWSADGRVFPLDGDRVIAT